MNRQSTKGHNGCATAYHHYPIKTTSGTLSTCGFSRLATQALEKAEGLKNESLSQIAAADHQIVIFLLLKEHRWQPKDNLREQA